jgi:hypothetical protein
MTMRWSITRLAWDAFASKLPAFSESAPRSHSIPTASHLSGPCDQIHDQSILAAKWPAAGATPVQFYTSRHYFALARMAGGAQGRRVNASRLNDHLDENASLTRVAAGHRYPRMRFLMLGANRYCPFYWLKAVLDSDLGHLAIGLPPSATARTDPSPVDGTFQSIRTPRVARAQTPYRGGTNAIERMLRLNQRCKRPIVNLMLAKALGIRSARWLLAPADDMIHSRHRYPAACSW